MRKITILALPLLAGCEPTAEQRYRQMQMDDAKCTGYGAKPGDAAYVQCRAQLDAARPQAEATVAAADRQPVAWPAPHAPLDITRGPVPVGSGR